MFGRFFKKPKAEPPPPEDYDEEAENAWYEQKSEYMQSILGAEHDMVMHAIIPFAIGGGLDLYYYPNGVSGTGIATKELVDANGEGPSNSMHDCYELVMFTKHTLNMDDAQNDQTPFGSAVSNINAILNLIARYSSEATLNPNETCEFPEEMEDVGGKCLVFDSYSPSATPGPQGMGLMAVIEVHRCEMEYARHNGGGKLLAILKQRGFYPYSDLDRDPVV